MGLPKRSYYYKLTSPSIKTVLNKSKSIKKIVLKLYLLLIKHSRNTIAKYPFGIFNIELTNRCIMKCVMCPRTYQMDREQGFMDFNVFKKIIDELAEANPAYGENKGVWLHHFGESLLHPEFDKFIRYAVEKNVKTQLSLNPSMLTNENILRILAAKPFLLQFSMDGHDNDSFFKIRGIKNCYDKSRENIMNFLELKEKYGSKIIIVLSMINFKENKDSIKELERYWRQVRGIDHLLIKPFVYWDGNIEEINKLEASSEEIIDNNMVTCNKPWETLTVLWNGDVGPCCFDYNGRYILGNIPDSTLLEIWNNERMISLRKEFIENNVSNPLCRNCRQLHAVSL